MGCVEYWTGLHVDLHPIHSLLRTTWTAQERCKAPYAVAAEEAGRVVWLGWMGWLAWWGGWQDGVEGRAGWGIWSVGWPGWVVGLARGGPDGWGEWIVGVKNVLE